MIFNPFPSIEGFHNIVKAIEKYPPLLTVNPIVYKGKIKLHGTNAGVQIKGNEYVSQSRSQIITPTNDNSGFAKWVETRKDFWQGIGNSLLPDTEITIFGEWCGPGIMKGTAINQIPNKVFAVFTIVVGNLINGVVIANPDDILLTLSNDSSNTLPDDIKVLPWIDQSFTVDFTNRDSLQKTAQDISALVQQYEPCDPWVKSIFGVDGIVFYPTGTIGPASRKFFSDFVFKAKGDKHKVVKTKEIVQVDPEVVATIDQFCKMFVTNARCEQGLAAIGGVADIKQMGAFLKWMGQDIVKESADELEASGLEWSDVQKAVQTAAKFWLVAKSREL